MLDRQQHCGIPLGHQELRSGQIPEELRPRHQGLPDCGRGEDEARQGESGTVGDQSDPWRSGSRRIRRQQRRSGGTECAERSDKVAVRGGAESGRGRGLVTRADTVIQ